MIGLRSRADDRTASLRSVELFSDCNRRELRQISSLTTVVEVQPGTVLIKQGNLGLEFIVVMRGTATAFRNECRVASFGPGAFFGEVSLLDSGDRTATVVADTDMRLLVSSRAEFRSLQAQVPGLVGKMSVEVCRRLREADHVLDRRSTRGTTRVAMVRLPAGGI